MHYFATLTSWHRPWWQPHWVRHLVNHLWPYADDAEIASQSVDRLRLLFGFIMMALVLVKFPLWLELSSSTLQTWFNGTAVQMTYRLQLLWWISVVGVVLFWLFFVRYVWHRHQVLHTQWQWVDVLIEGLLLPTMWSMDILVTFLAIVGLFFNWAWNPLIGTLLLCWMTFNALQFLFILLQWQFYYQSYVKTKPGFKNSLL